MSRYLWLIDFLKEYSYNSSMKMTPFGLGQENKMFISIGAIKAAEWSTSFINNLPDSSFAYIEPGGKKDDDAGSTKSFSNGSVISNAKASTGPW